VIEARFKREGGSMTTTETTDVAEAKTGLARAVELLADPELATILAADENGPARFLVAADWARERDAERDCPALVLALRAFAEPVKIGPKAWRAWHSAGGRYAVEGKLTGRRMRSRFSGIAFVDGVAGVVGAIADALDAEAAKAAKRKARSADAERLKGGWVNPFKVGDLVSNSWGYEQTNWDFAQVVAVGPRSVTLRRVLSEMVEAAGPMSGYVRPRKDRFPAGDAGKPRVVRFTFSVYGGTLHARLPARHGSWSAVGDRERFLETWYG
jgi:hypothetical protein